MELIQPVHYVARRSFDGILVLYALYGFALSDYYDYFWKNLFGKKIIKIKYQTNNFLGRQDSPRSHGLSEGYTKIKQ